MSGHSVPDEMLVDYVVGALPAGPALAIAVKMSLDPHTRRIVDGLNLLGGEFFEDQQTSADTRQAISEQEIDAVLSRLENVPVEPPPASRHALPGMEWMPPVLANHLPSSPRWRRAVGGFEYMPVGVPDDTHRVQLIRLQPGRGLPQHRHAGAEFTVVMAGGYTDATGSYSVGDMAIGHGTLDHRPVADPGEPCIAVVVLEQPVLLTGKLGRYFNPLVRLGLL